MAAYKQWFDKTPLTEEEDKVMNEVARKYFPNMDLNTAKKRELRNAYLKYVMKKGTNPA